MYHVDRVIRETGDVVANGVYAIYANIAVDDGSEIAELMQFFKKSEGTNAKFPKLCGRPEAAKEAILEEYSDVDEKLIDEIIEEIYGLVKSC
ncbi:MAG: hypothetical protein K1W30_06220 [Lachnospiraceae bacterium]